MGAYKNLDEAMDDYFRNEFHRALHHGSDKNIQTSTNAEPQPLVDFNKMFRELEKIVRETKRHQITFVVDLAHPGPPVSFQTPHDGLRIELSYEQAQQLHLHWPMIMVKVIDEHCAEFSPAPVGQTVIVPKVLQPPPYRTRDGDTR